MKAYTLKICRNATSEAEACKDVDEFMDRNGKLKLYGAGSWPDVKANRTMIYFEMLMSSMAELGKLTRYLRRKGYKIVCWKW